MTEAQPLVRGMTWEEMKEGAAFRTACRTVTETDLMSFVHLGGFNEPLFYDARHAAEDYGAARLIRQVEAHAALGAPELGEKILADLEAFLGGDAPADDVTLIVVKVL